MLLFLHLCSVLIHHCCLLLAVPNCFPSTKKYFAYSLTFVPTPSRHRLDKGVVKARKNFLDWAAAEHSNNNNNNAAILLIDGNNLRGIGKFEWNFVELQDGVARFCHNLNITKSIVVWDHGRCPTACHTSYQAENNNDDNDASFALDMIILFSGTSQRADDVLISESKNLLEIFSTEHGNSHNRQNDEELTLNWSNLAFVTQDRELNYKLRRQAGLVLDRQTKRSSTSDKASTPPLFCDSTRFLELVRNTTDTSWRKDDSDERISEALNEAKESMIQFHRKQRRGYNPRREKTWERVVTAEVYRSLLARQTTNCNTNNNFFVQTYLADLETCGYSLTHNEDAEQEREGDDPLPFVGPSRLDKKQRRSLQRYNKFIQNRSNLLTKFSKTNARLQQSFALMDRLGRSFFNLIHLLAILTQGHRAAVAHHHP